jgi:hypothetical protein
MNITLVTAGEEDPEPLIRAAELFVIQHARCHPSTHRASSITTHVSSSGVPFLDETEPGKAVHGAGIRLRENGNDGWASVEEDANGLVTVVIGGSPGVHQRARVVYADPVPEEPPAVKPAANPVWRGRPVAGSMRSRWEIWSRDGRQYATPDGTREWSGFEVTSVLLALNEAPL